MKINNKIIKILKDNNMNIDNCLCYLFCIFFNIKPDFIPSNIILKLNIFNIYYINDKGIIEWYIPLFEELDIHFKWVIEEYIDLFKEVDETKAGFENETLIRMRNLFSNNPEIRKEDVIGATKLYLQYTDKKYIRQCHFFIKKGIGINKTEDILTWIKRYKELENKDKHNDTTLNNILQ